MKTKKEKDIPFIVGVIAIIAIFIGLAISIIIAIIPHSRYKILDKKYVEKEIVISKEEDIVTKEIGIPHYFIQIEKDEETKEWIEVKEVMWYTYNIFDYYYE